MFYVMDERTGRIVHPGDMVTDFRGDQAVFIGATRAREQGRTGKVHVRMSLDNDGPTADRRHLYDVVFNLAVATADQAFPCGCPAQWTFDMGHQEGCTYTL